MERNFSGSCRVQDGPRLVFVEDEDGVWEADCNYEVCVYRTECPIGREITAFLREQTGKDI